MCFCPKDATISLSPTEFTLDEGSGHGPVTVCVVISNLPMGGLQCEIIATLTVMENTACMYPAVIVSVLSVILFCIVI